MTTTVQPPQYRYEADPVACHRWCFIFGLPLRLKGLEDHTGLARGKFYTGVWFPFFRTHVTWAKTLGAWCHSEIGDYSHFGPSSARPDDAEHIIHAAASSGLGREQVQEVQVRFSLSTQMQLQHGLPFKTYRLILGRWAFWITRDPYIPRQLPPEYYKAQETALQQEGKTEKGAL